MTVLDSPVARQRLRPSLQVKQAAGVLLARARRAVVDMTIARHLICPMRAGSRDSPLP